MGIYNYTPYGNLISHTGSASTNLGYEGQFSDSESGLIYLRARYYDPVTGQFLTRDPLSSLTHPAYGYGANNPINRADPSGLSAVGSCVTGSFDLHAGIGGTVSAEVCTWTGSFDAATLTVSGAAGVGLGGGPSGTVGLAYTAESSSEALAGFGCPAVGGSAQFGGGVAGNIDFCGNGGEGDITIGTPTLSGNISEGYTWVVQSNDGYVSSVPTWARWIYESLKGRLQSNTQGGLNPPCDFQDSDTSTGVGVGGTIYSSPTGGPFA